MFSVFVLGASDFSQNEVRVSIHTGTHEWVVHSNWTCLQFFENFIKKFAPQESFGLWILRGAFEECLINGHEIATQKNTLINDTPWGKFLFKTKKDQQIKITVCDKFERK
ncbi:MAG: hypothetical protein H6850_02625 [Alphaproteobacteria bacterium]|nr:MAG: hypothetical protein H6850_02625 [Alphaproteobacteria bacterium]